MFGPLHGPSYYVDQITQPINKLPYYLKIAGVLKCVDIRDDSGAEAGTN